MVNAALRLKSLPTPGLERKHSIFRQQLLCQLSDKAHILQQAAALALLIQIHVLNYLFCLLRYANVISKYLKYQTSCEVSSQTCTAT